jgi:hypothetical protein
MASIEVTLQSIAPSKLLNYVQKQKLIDFVSPQQYAELEHRLRQSLNKSKITLKDVKQHLATRPDFILSLRKDNTGAEAFQKYTEAVNRLRGLDKGKAQAVRKVMNAPRARYKGCLATRLQPTDYEYCLNNYDDEQYDRIGMVPNSLKQRVYDNGDVATRGILKETLTRKTGTLSDIPNGYRSYISKNPDKFKDYFESRRHELGLLRSVLRNLSSDDKRKLQAYYQQHKTIEPEKFSEIIASFRDTVTGSPKRRREETVGNKKGGRFNLEERVNNQDSFYDGASLLDLSINDVLE